VAFVEDQPNGVNTTAPLCREPQDEEVQNQTHDGFKTLAGVGIARQEDPALSLLNPLGCRPSPPVFRLSRQQLRDAGDSLKTGENFGLLVTSVPGDERFERGPSHSAVNLGIGPRDPMVELLRCRPKLKQVREDFTWAFDEKPLFACTIRVQGLGERVGFDHVHDLIRGRPVGHACVERTKDGVIPIWVIELRQIFLGRIVDDRGFFTIRDLNQELPDEGGLARTGVTDEEEVLALLETARLAGGKIGRSVGVALCFKSW
jgi:hypothetical protein